MKRLPLCEYKQPFSFTVKYRAFSQVNHIPVLIIHERIGEAITVQIVCTLSTVKEVEQNVNCYAILFMQSPNIR